MFTSQLQIVPALKLLFGKTAERYCLSSSIRQYFKPTVNLPTTSQVQMSQAFLKG